MKVGTADKQTLPRLVGIFPLALGLAHVAAVFIVPPCRKSLSLLKMTDHLSPATIAGLLAEWHACDGTLGYSDFCGSKRPPRMAKPIGNCRGRRPTPFPMSFP
jgi:hypothetical protein